jgi:hypothetical protein
MIFVSNSDFPSEYYSISIKQTLLDQFLQDWNSSVHNSPKAFNHRIFKTDFKFEEYFNILDEQNSLLLCKFRTTNHKLPIEKGRWSNIPRENRYCELCGLRLPYIRETRGEITRSFI